MVLELCIVFSLQSVWAAPCLANNDPVILGTVQHPLAQAVEEREASHVQPVVHKGTIHFQPELVNVETATAVFKHTGDAKLLNTESDAPDLKQGEVLVTASKTTLVRSAPFVVALAKGGIVLITRTDDFIKVRNLYDNPAGVYFAGTCLAVRAGHEVVIARDMTLLRNTVARDQVGRRQVRLFNLSCGGTMLLGEFMPVALMKRTEVLRCLYTSRDPADHATSNKLVKMAAALVIATAARGNYRLVTQ